MMPLEELARVTPDQYESLKKLSYPVGKGRRREPHNVEVLRWLRDEHKIFIEVQLDQTSFPKFAVKATHFVGVDKWLTIHTWEGQGGWLHRRYEEAENSGIETAIKYLMGVKDEED